jgi:hypothetical protein
LDANDPDGYVAMSRVLVKGGRPAEGLEFIETAMRLDPQSDYLYRLGDAQFHLERYDEAAATLLRATKRSPGEPWRFILLAAAYGQLGREQEAKSAIETFNKMRAEVVQRPLTLVAVGSWPFKYSADRELLREGLRKAGLPEGEKVARGMTESDKAAMAKREGGTWYGKPYNVVFPSSIAIDEPADDVPTECQAWLGVWADGNWDGTRPTGLIVHSVSFVDGVCLAEITLSRGVSTARDFQADGRNSPRLTTGLTATVKEDWLTIDRSFEDGAWIVSYTQMPGGSKLRGKAHSAKRDRTDSAILQRMEPPYIPPE